MKLIDMKSWSTLFPAADQEDLEAGEMMICKNLEPKYGKLVKTHGPGVKLDEAISESGNSKRSMFGTFIHPNLVSGFLYTNCYIVSGSKAVTHFGWDNSLVGWDTLDNFVPNYSLTPDRGTYWYQKVQRGNPLILYGDELRGLCGKLDAVNSEPALPLWCGYIDRDFFYDPVLDSVYEPSSAFYAYTAPLVAPDITFTIEQIQGGPYNPERTKISISTLSEANNTITISGEQTDILPGDYIRIVESTANDGNYLIDKVELDSGDTVMHFNSSYGDLGDSTLDGYVIPFAKGEKKWYKFSYIYDGVQESLMSLDPICVNMNLFDGVLPKFEFDIADKTAHNFRITGVNVYRAEERGGIYGLIQTIDFLRPSTHGIGDAGVGGGATGAHTGHGAAYIPDLSDFTFVGATTYTLSLKAPDGTWFAITFTGVSGTSHTHFYNTSSYVWQGEDYWDSAWILSAGATRHRSGSNGAFAGENTVIFSAFDAGDYDAAGGVLYLNNGPDCAISGNKGVISNVYTWLTGNRAEFKTAISHKLKVGDMVELFEFAADSGYNGTYMVLQTTAADKFVVEARYGADTTGKWALAGGERVVDDNRGYAVHVTRPYKVKIPAVNTEKWILMKPHWGLYYATNVDGTTYKYKFYDNGITAGAPHYLAGEKSIHINGDCAVVVQDILFQGNLFLDPGGKNEERSNYISFSMPGKLDVNPASRIKRINDREGGNPLVQLELEGNLVTVTKFGMTTTFIENPGDPATWKHVQSRHNLGTIARLGCISAVGSIFTPALDGIYRLRPNNLARSDKTPLDVMKITEEIDNIYMAMSLAQKQAIVAGYDPIKSEVVFNFSYDQDQTHYDSVFAYDVVKGTWREVHTSVIPAASFLDEEGNLLVWDDGSKIHSFAEDATDPRITLRIPYQLISDEREEVVRDVKITYMAASNLVVNVYADHSTGNVASGSIEEDVVYVNSGYNTVTYNGSDYTNEKSFVGVAGVTRYATQGYGKVIAVKEELVDTFELPASVRPVTYHYRTRTRCMKFALEITEDNADYLKTSFGNTYLIVARHGGEYPNTEIHRIRIWHD